MGRFGWLASASNNARWSVVLAAITVACSGGSGGGGGGGNGGTVTLSFASAAGALTEGGAAASVQVVLHTTQSATTKVASVNVFDRTTGTATSAADFAAFAPQVLTFPIGSLDGDVQSVSLAALDDHRIEGVTETIKLGLNNAAGATANNVTTYTASITDIHNAGVHFAAATSTTPDESGVARSVDLVLDVPPGVTLGVDVSATVQVSGGSATAGADYASFAPRSISFPAGSLDGSTSTVALDVIDDPLDETDETIDLALSAPSAGVALAIPSTHDLTIQDDDMPAGTGPAHLVVTEGATGVEHTLASSDLVDLGTQVVQAGPNAGTQVRLANTGGDPMSFGAPSLTGANVNDFAVTLDAASFEAISANTQSAELAPDVLSPLESLPPQTNPGRGIAVALNKSRLDALALLPRATVHGLAVPGMGEVTLELKRMTLPIAAGAVLKVDGVAQPGGIAAALGDLSLWTGSVLEQPGSRVFLALSSESSRGFIELPFDQDRFVHIVTESAHGPVRVMREADLAASGFVAPPFACDDPPLATGPDAPASMGGAESMPPAIGSLDVADCRIAIETDYQLFAKFGSTPALTSYVTQLMAAVSAQYVADVQATFSIAYLGVYTNASDPWTAQDSGGSASSVLNEFVNDWSGGNWPVSANLAHFISGASLGGGVAYVNVLCNQSFGFGVSGNIAGTINWSTWTYAPGNFTWDFVVVAHEIGHNFGANHTHSYCPPLDQCYTNCTGPTFCSQGTIMSYCHVCGGMDNIELYFHPVCANIMRNSVNSSCLGTSTLSGGNWVQYHVRFNPLTATGGRDATLQFTHNASNQPTPFLVRVHGTAN